MNQLLSKPILSLEEAGGILAVPLCDAPKAFHRRVLRRVRWIETSTGVDILVQVSGSGRGSKFTHVVVTDRLRQAMPEIFESAMKAEETLAKLQDEILQLRRQNHANVAKLQELSHRVYDLEKSAQRAALRGHRGP